MEEKRFILQYVNNERDANVQALLAAPLDFLWLGDVWAPKPGFIITCREDVVQQLKEMFPWIINIHRPV